MDLMDTMYSVPRKDWADGNGNGRRRQEIYCGTVGGDPNDRVTAVLRFDEKGMGSILVKRNGGEGRRTQMAHLEYRNGDNGDSPVASHRDASVVDTRGGRKSNSYKTKVFRIDDGMPLGYALLDTALRVMGTELWEEPNMLEKTGVGSQVLRNDYLPIARCLCHLADQVGLRNDYQLPVDSYQYLLADQVGSLN